MKSSEFQDKVLTHLGSDAEWKKNIYAELCELKDQVKLTNGTVKTHQSWIDNFNGRIAVVGAIVFFGANILWSVIKDSFIK